MHSVTLVKYVGECISLDQTFRAANKASIADETLTRSKPMHGGLLSIINEDGEILAWVSRIELYLQISMLMIT